MTQEEQLAIQAKAKRYDKAIEALRSLFSKQAIKHCDRVYIKDITNIFPELKDSEDEKIRKTLIEYFKVYPKDYYCELKTSHILAWLEKQGESDETKAKTILINKGYPIDANGTFPTYEEMYDIIKEGLEKQGEQKPTIEMKSAEESLGIDSDTYSKIVDECIYGEQKHAEWSEDDEHRFKDAIYFLDTAKKHYASTVELDACIAWLKSLKPQNQWKPSDEQMETLENVRKILHTNDIYSKANNLMYNFEELIRTLKKLREGQL